ncbi:MAG: NlpC/P60 family protein [Actinomyces sp.]|uniref:C40 family peptidase n=1 Tax=Actinomyces sp. TaxID=29317 RepID=UPI0026DCD6F2|nr:NlpC/P60 family protein [Actinomyces sp.]MDO4244213.1 NlpC/P60 family protein [Actinomyces sp.]
MSTTTKARHRKASRPVTPLTNAAPAARRGLAVAASSGLALTMIASGASAANSTEVAASAGSLEAAGTGALAADARAAITTNAALTVASDVNVPADVTAPGEVTVQAPVVVEPETTAVATEDTEASVDTAVDEDTADTSTTATAVSAPAPSANGSSIVAIAMQYVGRPYVSGATGPEAFDCSGLVQYVYAQAGISLPRTSYAQGAAGTMVSAAEAQPGDLVYYGYHVGIYAGNGMMIDAGTTSTGVVYRQIWGNPIGYIRVG